MLTLMRMRENAHETIFSRISQMTSHSQTFISQTFTVSAYLLVHNIDYNVIILRSCGMRSVSESSQRRLSTTVSLLAVIGLQQ